MKIIIKENDRNEFLFENKFLYNSITESESLCLSETYLLKLKNELYKKVCENIYLIKHNDRILTNIYIPGELLNNREIDDYVCKKIKILQ